MILLTATEQNIRDLIFWGQLLIVGALMLRTILDMLKGMDDISELPAVLKRSKKKVVAAIIAITIESTAIWIYGFYT